MSPRTRGSSEGLCRTGHSSVHSVHLIKGRALKDKEDVETLEIRLLLEAVYQMHGWDFRDYALTSIKRRIQKFIAKENLRSISALQDRLLHDQDTFQRFLLVLSIDVTSMFRDAEVYAIFRKKVVPLLQTYPFIRIWHVGCATGEEVYSMAILLKEEGLLEKTRLYASDMNEVVIEKARDGIYPVKNMKEYTENYIQAGGKSSFSEYYNARYGNVRFKDELKKNIVWAQHNLVTDASFNEFHVILCRNVMIYFNNALTAHVHKLLYESLALMGVLCLGLRESVSFTPFEKNYEVLDYGAKLFQKIR